MNIRPLLIASTILVLSGAITSQSIAATSKQKTEASSTPAQVVEQVVDLSDVPQNIAHESYVFLNLQNLMAYRLSLAYHMLSVQKGAPKARNKIDTVAKIARDNLANLQRKTEHEALDKELAEVSKLWKNFEKLAKSNTIVKKGITDAKTTEKMHSAQEALSNKIIVLLEALKNNPEVKNAFAKKPFFEAALLAQRLASDYAHGSAALSGTSPASALPDGETETVDVLAKRFDYNLSELRDQYKTQFDVSERLQKVSNKWEFIEKRLYEYNTNNVPYIVSIYSEKMVSELIKTAMEDESIQFSYLP